MKTTFSRKQVSLESVGTGVQRPSLRVDVTGTYFLCRSLVGAAELSFDGSIWVPVKVGEKRTLNGGEVFKQIFLRSGQSPTTIGPDFSSSVDFETGTGDVQSYPVGLQKTLVLGDSSNIANGGNHTFPGICGTKGSGVWVGDSFFYQRVRVKFYNAGAGDVTFAGGMPIKAGTFSDWIETTDDIVISNASGGACLVSALQICLPDIISSLHH